MRAIVIQRVGGPEVLAVEEVPTPVPGEGQLLVDSAAAGVNYIDTYLRSGMYPVELPFGLGVEGAGTVREIGPGVTGFAVGDLVAWNDSAGSYAEQVLVPAATAVAVPAGLAPELAAAVLLQGMTAHYLVDATYPVRDGDTVLVHAAAGGVGLLLVQLAKARGARVLGTVSTEEKAQLARTAGADEVIRYTEQDVAAQVRRLTGGAGVDAVYDGVGASTFDASLASLRPRGTLAVFGASSGPVAPFDLRRLNSGGSLFVTRPTLKHYTADRAELEMRAGAVFGAVLDGNVTVRIGGRYPLAEAARAHEDLQARRTTGKLLLLPH